MKLKGKKRSLKAMIMHADFQEDSTVDDIWSSRIRTIQPPMRTSQVRWSQFDSNDFFGMNSSRMDFDYRKSFDFQYSKSYLKDQSIRSTIFHEQSLRDEKNQTVLTEPMQLDADKTFVNMEKTMPREKPSGLKPFTYRRQPNVIHYPEVYPEYRYDPFYSKPRSVLGVHLFKQNPSGRNRNDKL